MNVELGPIREAAAAKARALLAELAKLRFWLQLAGVTAVALLVFGMIGRAAHSRAEVLEMEASRIAEIHSRIERWDAAVTSPGDEERRHWAQSEEAFLRLGAASAEPLAVANQLARRGDDVGPRDVRIRLVSSDSAFIPPPTNVGEWAINRGNAVLVVETSGSWSSAISFLGALPPTVELSGLEVSESVGTIQMTVTLVSREISRAGG